MIVQAGEQVGSHTSEKTVRWLMNRWTSKQTNRDKLADKRKHRKIEKHAERKTDKQNEPDQQTDRNRRAD